VLGRAGRVGIGGGRRGGVAGGRTVDPLGQADVDQVCIGSVCVVEEKGEEKGEEGGALWAGHACELK
jgi:hypothetical protein